MHLAPSSLSQILPRRSHRMATALLLALAGTSTTSAAALSSSAPSTEQVQKALGGLGVPFEANTGQWDAGVAYLAKTFAGNVVVMRDGRIVYDLPGKVLESAAAKTSDLPKERQQPTERGPGWRLSETLVGALPLSPQGQQQAATQVSRFTPQGSYHSVTYQSIQMGQAWPGIALELAARGNNVEKLFHVAPGADARQIQLQVGGAQALTLGSDGSLIASTGNGDVAYTPPVAWQTIEGQRVPVPVRYALLDKQAGQRGKPAAKAIHANRTSASARYGFTLGAHDPAYPLTIDPLLQSTYLGGGSDDRITALAVAPQSDGSFDVIVAGYTTSSDLPCAAGSTTASSALNPTCRQDGAQKVYKGGLWDGFVARLSGDLRTLRQSTYLGGGGYDLITALAVAPQSDGSFEVIVGGYTYSTNLPCAAGSTIASSAQTPTCPQDGAQRVLKGIADGFVARLSGDLRAVSPQTLTFHAPNPASRPLVPGGSVAFGAATASSGLPVSYSAGPAGVCTLADPAVSTLTMVGVGTCTVVARQAGNAQWQPAEDVSQTLTFTAQTDWTGPVPGMTGSGGVAVTGGSATCTLDTSAATGFVASPGAAAEAELQALHPGATLPYGAFTLRASGCAGDTLTVTITYPEPLPAGLVLLKWGPPAAGAAQAWFAPPGLNLSASRRTVSYLLDDDGAGDSETVAAGVIIDPFAPVLLAAVPVAVPTLGQWALILLGGLIGALGLRRWPVGAALRGGGR
ncbi:IPTL-CTERM sorting domain-containing protein [Ottowia sp. GY511]|uniref:IPTL-CTERM sorting domain-containing protein n=1 Tax=Ottowia sp. GY511 TaxID=2603274 RepID=UPI0011CA9E5F|nr:IPTL-CTERM sorting domain-containing protein [Ottowia sp. GY511]TXK33325.1 IPTL-CTERM sorting domain-containing protein [Ottowia sp. GY511]